MPSDCKIEKDKITVAIHKSLSLIDDAKEFSLAVSVNTSFLDAYLVIFINISF